MYFRETIAAAVLALLSVVAYAEDAAEGVMRYVNLSGGARAYFESAYFSSSGTLSYTKPVAEQVAWLKADFGDFGYMLTDGWLCSALNGQTDHIHRRACYCYEGTLCYGYDLNFTETVHVDSNAGLLWDWLGGYESDVGTPLAILAMQKFHNPVLTPYWNLLHRFDENRYVRIRTGVEHQFLLVEAVKLTPFAEGIWGDASRYKLTYGDSPSYCFLNGAYMVGTAGFIVDWSITKNWYVWGRFRQFFTVNPVARSLAQKKDTIVHHTDHSIYGIGVGCRF